MQQPIKAGLVALGMAAGLASSASAQSAAAICASAPSPETMQLEARNQHGTARLLPSPGPLKVGQQFSATITLCGDAAGLALRGVDATMPAHGHGMNYRARLQRDEERGTWQASGMLLHMPGVWRFSVEASGPDGRVVFTQDVTVLP